MSDSFSLTIRPPREDGANAIIDLKPTMLTRLRRATNMLMGNDNPPWFGPENPLQPQAPPDAAGREFDYMTGYNLSSMPKYTEGFSFSQLRMLADTWDLLRTIIETRKDQVCQLEWNIVPRDPTKTEDPRSKDIEAWFQSPDKEHTWEEWLRMLLEDLLVIDAPCLYPRLANDGTLYGLEPVDGSTIKRVIDERGRTPIAPLVAYQQILKGVPATDYDRDTLVYRPRNLRTNKVYGYSPVEQIIVTINTALNRQVSQLQFYTQGSTPDLILSVPESWTPDQIKQFKFYWDSILKGNTGARRGTMFVHNGMKPVNTKDKLMQDGMGEWLARVACFAFSMSPSPFIQDQNRGQAAQMATQAKEEGLEPMMAWIRNLMNYILNKYFAAPDLMFRWTRDMETDPLTRAQVFNIKTRAGAMTANEWRAKDGDGPIEGGDVAMIYTATGATPLELSSEQEELPQVGGFGDGADAPTSGTAKGGANAKPQRNNGKPSGQKSGAAKPPSRAANGGTGPRGSSKSNVQKARGSAGRPVTKVEVDLAKALTPALRSMGSQTFIELIGAGIGTLASKSLDASTVVANLKFPTINLLRDPLRKAMAEQMTLGYTAAVTQILHKASNKTVGIAQGDTDAYAASRTDALLDDLEQTTRTMVEGLVEEAIEKQWSVKELAEALQAEYAFSASRAATIAATEMNDALTHAELSAWEQTGLVKAIEWSKSSLEGVCTVCEANADQGPIPIGTMFSSGDDGPPAHPNCRCALIPVVEL